ncbi:MAG TPA: trehalose-phosphatase [Devosiaceae bacterium]|nr:trehalose-phosphatase [Devosiaceae bacterium]
MSPIATAGFRPDFDSVALFSDFDGTLVDLAPTPESILVPQGLGRLLGLLASSLEGAFAIITGRPIADVAGFLAPARFAIAGAHGAERQHADGRYEGPPAEIVAACEAIAASLDALHAREPRILVEKKPGAVALHYRLAPELETACRAAIAAAIHPFPEFSLIAGKMVFEARPRGIGKGEAVRQFLAEPPFVGRWPLFIGDDTTDEDGFVAAQELGGLGIKVGAGESAARLRLPDTHSVRALLVELAAGRNEEVKARLSAPQVFLWSDRL